MEDMTKIERSSTWRHLAFRLVVPAAALAVLGIVGLSAISARADDPKPTCVECPAGYHCVHNPEGCKKD